MSFAVVKLSYCKDSISLLEVGALKADNYKTCKSWIDCMPIDLHSRHPHIIEQNFLTMDMREHENKWDAISLSLVVNFVPLPADRGEIFCFISLMIFHDLWPRSNAENDAQLSCCRWLTLPFSKFHPILPSGTKLMNKLSFHFLV